jgi:hypothetical protein
MNQLMTRTAKLYTSMIAAAVVLVAAIVLVSISNHAAADDPPATIQQEAQNLTDQPAISAHDSADTNVSQRLSPNETPTVASEIAKSVPLPPGGTVKDIDWKLIGNTSAESVRSFVEFNASCDWLKYWIKIHDANDQSALDSANTVIQTIPDWPSFRNDQGAQGVLGDVIKAAAAGDPEPVKANVEANCS